MKILLVVANFYPEIGSAAHIYYDLARAFIKNGHEVDVLTSYPRRFNLIEVDAIKIFPFHENLEGIQVHRCRHPAKRDNLILRGMEHFLLQWYYFRLYKKINKKFDICLMYIPPLPFWYLAKKIKGYDGTPSILNFQDFLPQELIDVGLLKNPIIIKILEHIEKESYKNADFITVLSEGGVNYIISKGGVPKRIKHIYNGSFKSNYDNFYIKSDFKRKEGIENKFLISYAGILSEMQGVDTILDVAQSLLNHKDIIFYIIGDGMLKDKIELKIENFSINNVKLLPLQPIEEYFDIINSSDISIVSLDKRMKAPCFPGKIVNLTAMRQPIIAIVPENSETARIVNTWRFGVVVKPEDMNNLGAIILKLKKDKILLEELRNNGRKFFEANMDLDKIVLMYEDIFTTLIKT